MCEWVGGSHCDYLVDDGECVLSREARKGRVGGQGLEVREDRLHVGAQG